MNNITIRKIEEADIPGICAVYADVDVYSNTLQLPDPTHKLWEQRLSSIPDNVHAYVALIDGEVVGNIGFEVAPNPRRRHVGSFGMGVATRHQGKGIGRALLAKVIDLADNWLNLQRIELTVYTDNTAAISLYEKFGFVREGESKAYAYRDGHFVDVYHMARIRTL